MTTFTKFYDGYSEVIKSMKPKEGEAPEAAPSYRSRIMNIPEGGNEPYTAKPLYGYSYGHRDARHAAAEIGGEADREIERLKTELFCERTTGSAALANKARLLEEFAKVAIELHVQTHYAVNGVRWEDCENCKEYRALLPEYAEESEETK